MASKIYRKLFMRARTFNYFGILRCNRSIMMKALLQESSPHFASFAIEQKRNCTKFIEYVKYARLKLELFRFYKTLKRLAILFMNASLYKLLKAIVQEKVIETKTKNFLLEIT